MSKDAEASVVARPEMIGAGHNAYLEAVWTVRRFGLVGLGWWVLRHTGTKVIARDVSSGCVCGDMRKQTEGSEEQQKLWTSDGFRMSGHTRRRVIGISGLESACFRRATHVWAYSRPTTPRFTRQTRLHPLIPAKTRAASPIPRRATATTPAGIISNTFGSYMPRMRWHTQPRGRHRGTVRSLGVCRIVHARAYAEPRNRHIRVPGRLLPSHSVCSGTLAIGDPAT